VRNLSIKLYRIYVCYTNIMLYHAIYLYRVQYYPRFQVTAVGLGTYYPWIRRSAFILQLSSCRWNSVLFLYFCALRPCYF